jgi:uncharacterized protein (TIGR03435 family)
MLEFIGNHLWQSTLFAAGTALLCLVLRRNGAQVRYWLWLAASAKFLLPFSLLTAAGSQIAWQTSMPAPVPVVTATFEAISEPFFLAREQPQEATAGTRTARIPYVPIAAGVWLAGTAIVLGLWWARWRRVNAVLRSATRRGEGREFESLARLAAGARVRSAPPLLVCETSLEPGVVGVFRPVLLWPRGISAHLTNHQIEAVLGHELAHIRRRDNLTAALHQIVQAIFWFHPVVWWLGARLMVERERACDQDVIRLGSRPEVYAESILRTCQFFVASPLPCVSGVTGADLKRRIEDIMCNRGGMALGLWKRLLLTAAAGLAFAGPVLVGTLSASQNAQIVIQTPAAAQTPSIDPNAPKPEFDAATIKPNPSGEMRVSMRFLPGGSYEATNVTLKALIQQAFRMQEFQVIGAPSWLENERYDILAKSPAGAGPAEFPDRLQSLLIDRLNLTFRRETRDAPVYALVLARDDGRLGPQIRTSSSDCTPAPARGRAGAPPAGQAPAAGGRQAMPMPVMPPLGETRPCTLMRNGGRLTGGGQTMEQLARTLQGSTGRVVLDRTGLAGTYDFDLEFTPDASLGLRGPGGGLPGQPEGPQPIDPDALSIFTALQEQLGVKLESTRGPVDVLVIERAERPADN